MQGPIHQKWTRLTLESVRKSFPKAQLILSTWLHENLEVIQEYDLLVQSADPGKDYGNLTRNIKGSLSGIQRADRPYCMRIRTDLLFKDNRCLEWFNVWDKHGTQFNLFDKRILVSAYYTLRRDCWVCDHFYLGTRADLLKLFSIPPRSEDRYSPESYIATGYLHKKYGNIDTQAHHDEIVGNNFCVLDAERQLGINCQKYPIWKDGWTHGSQEPMMTHFEWIQLYYKSLRSNE